MKLLIARIKGVFYYLVGIEWIHPPAGEWSDYKPIPIYIIAPELCPECNCAVLASRYCMMGHWCGEE